MEGDTQIIFCDECRNYINPCPDNRNPCRKGHTMDFKMPISPCDDLWGFYKLHCKDRTSLKE